MKILIDTQVFLWATLDKNLPERIKKLIEADSSELFLSTASAWEISIKYALGKLPLPEHPKLFIGKTIKATNIKLLPITFEDVVAVSDMPHHHKDPFDRLLVVQANLGKFRLLSVDPDIKKYSVDLITFKPR